MLRRVKLQNFKCHEKLNLELSALTLLSGVNSAGKSTVIQALLTLCQSSKERCLRELLLTNGDLVNLGNATDVIYENAQNNSVIITLCYDDNDVREYIYHLDDGMFRGKNVNYKGKPFLNAVLYLSAERLGPRTCYPIMTLRTQNYNRIGNSGEFSGVQLAARSGSAVSCPNLVLPSAPQTVLGQTEAWLSRVSQELRIHIDPDLNADLVTLQYSFRHGKLFSQQYRTTNVGFGITYALPIFVAVLSAAPGDLVIIENPEAHLHPKGQAIMGEFLALAAQGGIQIIIETHSDHLLNGVRVAVKRNKIDHNNVQVHFFTHSRGGASQIVSPRIDSSGRFDQWPEDFFDEWDKQLAELL